MTHTLSTVNGVRVHRFKVDPAYVHLTVQEWCHKWNDRDVLATDHVVAIVVGGHVCAVTTPTCGLGTVAGPWDTMAAGRYARAYSEAARLARQAHLALTPVAAPDQPAPGRQRDTQEAATATVAVPELSAAQRKTLATIISKGGEMNGYSGQRGIDVRSLPVLVTKKLLDYIGTCECWETDGDSPCTLGHGEVDTAFCYQRVRVNAAGRAAHAAYGGGSS